MPPHRLSRAARAASGLLLTVLGPTTAGAHAAPGPTPAPGPGPGPADGAPVSFRNEVMAVLSKAGCNAGACHGNASGKGGFKLSLRGESPADDLAALTRGALGRRVNLEEPGLSLILLKPLGEIAHEGGRRFRRGDPEASILRRWVAAGARDDPPETPRLVDLEAAPGGRILAGPKDALQLAVRATFSNGSARDVTRLASFEFSQAVAEASADGRVQFIRHGETTVLVRYLHRQVPVRLAHIPAREAFVWAGPDPANVIDEAVFSKLKQLRLNPAPPASDAAFCRRVTLDLLGIPPDPEEARAFVADPSPGKRAALVDELLERPEFADHWALKWADLLRVEEKVLDRKGVAAFHGWIRRSIAENKPLDVFAREIIAARGSTYRHPPANFYRAARKPAERAVATAQVFLGTRLQCAQCHNHPFDRWTQDDYYSWAGLFSRVRYKVLENRRRDSNDKHQFDGEQVVWMAGEGEVKNPRTGADAPPRFLGDPAGLPPGADRLEALAGWVASPENPRFAAVQVNRVWFHLMGRGLVHPVDDFRATNPASHPGLLDDLTRGFVEAGFDLRWLIRAITSSRTYQLGHLHPGGDPVGAADNFAYVRPRRLGAEAMLDAVAAAAGVPVAFNGYPLGTRAGQIPGVHAINPRYRRASPGDRFLVLFGKPPRLAASDTERTCQPTVSQAFQFVSGPLIHDLLTRPDNRLAHLLASGLSHPQIVDQLYWATLTRPPSTAEREAFVRYLDEASPKHRRAALEDLAAALLGSAEFWFRK